MVTPSVVFFYALIPMVVSMIGGGLSAFFQPTYKWSSVLQHFVAGIVISAVASDLVPKLFESGTAFTVAIGFIAGVIVMLLIHALAHFVADRAGSGPTPYGLIFAAAIDLLIDGLLIGVAFAAGESSGILIALSLSLCGFFLNLTIGTTLAQNGGSRALLIASTVCVSIMLPIGALIGGLIVQSLPHSLILEVIAFGVAALLFLGCEELLAPAHRKHHSSLASLALFLGFLLVLIFKF